MFEMLRLIGFTYAGFCFLLPKGEESEENGTEGTRVRRDEPAKKPDRPAVKGMPLPAAPRRRLDGGAAEHHRNRCRR
jgi:hypothetical protein